MPPVADCGVDAQKAFVEDVANDWYRWYAEMAPVSPGDFDTAEAYLAALTAPLAVDFRDPGFSYLTTVAEDEANFTTGAFIGFGFRFAVTDDNRFLISDVFEGGAADGGGFRRGLEILAIDAGEGFVTLAEFEAQGATTEEIFGPAEIGVVRGFRLGDGDTVTEVSIAKAEVDVPPLASAPALVERPGLPPVGYLHLRAFTTSANAALDTAFAELRDRGVTDFVIDLRYNGGGTLETSQRLLDLLGGAVAESEPAFRISHNDKQTDSDETGFFRSRSQSVAPLRIAFITTEATASASELVINSMAPHADVVLVGSDTLGKAVGQYAFDQPGCDTRLRLVSFELVNGEDQGGYYTGLVDTGRFTLCAAEDSFAGAFGDPAEPMLGAALDWLDSASCAVSASGAASGLPRLGAASALGLVNVPDRRSPFVQ